MAGYVLHLNTEENITLSPATVKRLIAGGSGDAALLYLAILHARGVSLPGVEGMNRGIRCHRPVQVTNGVPLTKETMSVTAESSETRETPEVPLPPVAQPTIRIGT